MFAIIQIIFQCFIIFSRHQITVHNWISSQGSSHLYIHMYIRKSTLQEVLPFLLTAWEMQTFIAVCETWASFWMYMYNVHVRRRVQNGVTKHWIFIIFILCSYILNLFSSKVFFSSLDLYLSILIQPCFPFSFRTFLFTLSWFSSSFSCLRFSHSFFSCTLFSFISLVLDISFIFISSPVSSFFSRRLFRQFSFYLFSSFLFLPSLAIYFLILLSLLGFLLPLSLVLNFLILLSPALYFPIRLFHFLFPNPNFVAINFIHPSLFITFLNSLSLTL